MKFQSIEPNRSISLFVKKILVFEENNSDQKTVLPFFADGYPGLMFQTTDNGLFVMPHNKEMPQLFLYGQTINPIELHIDGKYKMIVLQLFPFVLKSLFNVEPKDLNDDCYDLLQLKNSYGIFASANLNRSKALENKIEILSALIINLFENKKQDLDLQIAEGIQTIIKNKGRLLIGNICADFNMSERNFERRFIKSVGVSAKHFSKIIQFQHSLEQLTVKDYTKLTDIVYSNGFSDQSHFIKVFKAFTGKTPSAFKSQK